LAFIPSTLVAFPAVATEAEFDLGCAAHEAPRAALLSLLLLLPIGKLLPASSRCGELAHT
jgi:hypothetical protein